MPKIFPFQNYVEQYEDWFNKNHCAFEAELKAVRSLLPREGRGLEIGVGTGRFAARLGIKIGVEPADKMRKIAQSREIKVLAGVAEALPFHASAFDFLLMVTTVCFLDDIHKAFQEAYRILTSKGYIIIAFVESKSPLGQVYAKHKNENVFYKDATFYSVAEIIDVMQQSGFGSFDFRQTIFRGLAQVSKNEPVNKGHGEGSFVVVRGRK